MNTDKISYMTAECIDTLSVPIFPICNLIDEIAADANISESFDYVVSHLESAQQREHIRPKKAAYCRELKRLLSTGQFRLTSNDFRTIEVKDGPKARIVQAPTVFHRVGCHAIMVPFERYTYPTLIKNTAASIKGRGMHWLHQIIEEDLLADPDNMQFFYQSDILGYYDHISQVIMKQQVRKYISDPLVLPMIDNFITLLPFGLSKGLRSSQCLANLHLNEVDHKMCERVSYHEIEDKTSDNGKGIAVKGQGSKIINGKEIRYHYYRYCDDIVIFGASKKELWLLRDYLMTLLSELGLTIKQSEAVRPIDVGLDYLGYVTFTDDSGSERVVYSRIRKRTKQKFARKIKKVKSRKRRKSLIGSFFGMAAHADCRHLLKTLITPTEYNRLKHKRKMKDIGDYKFTTPTLDGKKNFPGNKISPRDLNGICFIVSDFERGLVAKRDKEEHIRKLQEAAARNVPAELVQKPKDKYVLQVIHHPALLEIWRDFSIFQGTEAEQEENRKKVLEKLRLILDQIKSKGELSKMLHKLWSGDKAIWHFIDELDAEGGVPFFTGLEMDYSGQYPKFRLVSCANFNMRTPTEDEENLIFKTLNLK